MVMFHQRWHQKLKGCCQHWAHKLCYVTNPDSTTTTSKSPTQGHHHCHQHCFLQSQCSCLTPAPRQLPGKALSGPQTRGLRRSGRSSGCLQCLLGTLPTLRFRQETLGAEGRQAEWETPAGCQMWPPFWGWLIAIESVRLLYSLSAQLATLPIAGPQRFASLGVPTIMKAGANLTKPRQGILICQLNVF